MSPYRPADLLFMIYETAWKHFAPVDIGYKSHVRHILHNTSDTALSPTPATRLPAFQILGFSLCIVLLYFDLEILFVICCWFGCWLLLGVDPYWGSSFCLVVASVVTSVRWIWNPQTQTAEVRIIRNPKSWLLPKIRKSQDNPESGIRLGSRILNPGLIHRLVQIRISRQIDPLHQKFSRSFMIWGLARSSSHA